MSELRPRSLGEILDAAVTLALRSARPGLCGVALVMTPSVLVDAAVHSQLPRAVFARWSGIERIGMLALTGFLALFLLDLQRSILDGGAASLRVSLVRAARRAPLGIALTELVLGFALFVNDRFWSWTESDSHSASTGTPNMLLVAGFFAIWISPLLAVWTLSYYAWGWTLGALVDSAQPSPAAALGALRTFFRSPRRRIFSELSFIFGWFLVSVLGLATFSQSPGMTELRQLPFIASSTLYVFVRASFGIYFLAFMLLARRDAAIRTEGLDLEAELARLEEAS